MILYDNVIWKNSIEQIFSFNSEKYKKCFNFKKIRSIARIFFKIGSLYGLVYIFSYIRKFLKNSPKEIQEIVEKY